MFARHPAVVGLMAALAIDSLAQVIHSPESRGSARYYDHPKLMGNAQWKQRKKKAKIAKNSRRRNRRR